MTLGSSGGSRRRLAGLVAAVALLVLAAAAVGVAARSGWMGGGLLRDGAALVRVRQAGLGARLAALDVRDSGGRRIPVGVVDGKVVPRRLLRQGERVSVDAYFERPKWLGWLLGREQHVRLTLTTPRARLLGRWLQVPSGRPVRVGFAAPVRAVSLASGRRRLLPRPQAEVTVPGAAASGRVAVAAAPRAWERLSSPATVTWFPAGPRPKAVVVPAPGTTLKPWQPLELTFSQPLARVLGSKRPELSPRMPGRWTEVDSHTLAFHPTGYGYGLGAELRLPLPVAVDVGAKTERTLSWHVASGSSLRLQQLLAQLGYLPLRWRPTGVRAGDSPLAQLNAALDPPAGRFAWRYPHVPTRLRALWQPGGPNTVLHGALIAFEHDHGLTTDGIAGPRVWRALLDDAVAGRGATGGYSYVLVHRSVPQTLTLWHDGRTILTARTNTGVPSAPTELGTYTVWLRFETQTMSGTNPDGSHYSDPGIRWISYFHGGEAIHGFNRGSYGYPQSVGCVELPVPVAARVWPYTPIGTLVTIAP